jgi:hypothetical protein
MPNGAGTATAIDVRPSAVVWIDRGHALVATTVRDGGIVVSEVTRRGGEVAPDANYLARVVERIGDRERVVILGPGEARLALEREYVAIYRRPERLVDVEPSGPLDRGALIERLRTLAA